MTALYAYLVLFAGMLLEGEITLLATAFAVHTTSIKLWLIIVVATVAIQLTDWFHFWIGRYTANTFLAKRPNLSRRVKRVSRWINRYPTLFLLIYRYIYGFRTVLPIAIGLSDISLLRFGIFSLFSGIVWSATYAMMGYYLGEQIIARIEYFQQYQWYIYIGIALFIILIFSGRHIYRWYRFKKINFLRAEHHKKLKAKEQKALSSPNEIKRQEEALEEINSTQADSTQG